MKYTHLMVGLAEVIKVQLNVPFIRKCSENLLVFVNVRCWEVGLQRKCGSSRGKIGFCFLKKGS